MEVILLIAVVVLFVKVSNLKDKVNFLSEKINILSENPPTFNRQENKVIPAATKQEPENKREFTTPAYKQPSFDTQEITSPTKRQEKEEIFISSNQKETEKFSKENSKKLLPEFHFTAAKLFSWIAAFAFILAVIFGLIYAVQNNIISKQMITAAAGLIGLILLAVGLMIKDEKLKTAAATLCASGITTFLIATYCAFSLYNMINLPVAFVLMATISFVSFYISAKKDMQFISFLGMVAAFITPLLLSTGNDNYIFFFTYIAFINGAAIAVSLKKGWNNLLASSLFFTFMCQIAWLGKDFNPQRANIFQIIFTIYSMALTAVYINLKEKLPLLIKYIFSAFIILGVFMFLPLTAFLGPTCEILFNLLILITISNVLIFILYYGEPDIFKIPAYITSSIFLFSLIMWTDSVFAIQTSGLLLLFVLLGASLANSLVINVKTKETFAPIVNLLALFIVFWTITQNNLKLENLAFVHNGVIIFNLVLFSIAYKFKDKLSPLLKTAFGSYILASLLFSFLFTLQSATPKDFSFVLANIFIVNTALLLLAFRDYAPYKLPLQLCAVAVLILLDYMLCAKVALLPYTFSSYLLLGAINLFSILHLAKKDGEYFSLIFAALWFLTMFSTTNMYYVWFAAITLNLICLSLARAYKKPSLILIAALGSSFIFNKAHDTYQVVIACVFFVLFFIYPFLCKKDFKEDSWQEWLASVYMGLVAWIILIAQDTFSLNINKGLIALPFGALFTLNAMALYKETLLNRYRNAFVITSMASIFFITAAISLIFTNQWFTLALAVEGAALIILNKKVPNIWSAKVGFLLLLIAFARLIFIRDFFTYYTLEAKLFNWYLLVYSISAGAMFSAAKYWISKDKIISAILNTAGAVLLFYLVNIEIANFFGNTGEVLTFNFFGNFAATITYTIAWTLYGATACLIAFYNKSKALLNVGVVIIALCVIKLFMFDLWALGILYRIIGLFAIAGILFGISLIFQKFRDRLKE
ncbi:MAG: DUF2339 domain-containing protein [Elusimicrobiaceae bacterium]|nr:DUF2339 domain-containing protein [Elusimicrobiaceae bacterium]